MDAVIRWIHLTFIYFINVMYLWWIVPFVIIIYQFQFVFSLAVLPDINIFPPVYFWLLFECYIFIYLFISNLFFSNIMCISYKQNIVGYTFKKFYLLYLPFDCSVYPFEFNNNWYSRNFLLFWFCFLYALGSAVSAFLYYSITTFFGLFQVNKFNPFIISLQ